LFSLVLISSMPWVAACDDDPVETCKDYAEVAPGGSFEDQVMPLFSRSCALASSCHQGDSGAGQEGLGLGPSLSMGAADRMTLDAIHDQLLNSASMRSPLPLIKAGDPAGSWLMAKMEYDTADLPVCAQCTGDDCGGFMPDGSNPDSGLTRAERDTVAAWILDGAQNN
jgi:hypothetical protein